MALDFVTASLIAEAEARFGEPATAEVRALIGEGEMTNLRASQKHGRAHDVTVFIRDTDGRLALIRKPSFPAGAFRVPSGGLRPGEPFERGTCREALEETGLAIVIRRYFLRIDASFALADAPAEAVRWQSHLVLADARGSIIAPRDHQEIAEARWGDWDELLGPIRRRLLRAGRGLLRYRVWLHDRAAEQLRPGR